MGETANKIQMVNIPLSPGRQERWVLPQGAKWFTLQTRGGTELRVAVTDGLVVSKDPPFFTVKADNSWDEKSLAVDVLNGIPLFFAADSPDVVEIMVGVFDHSGQEDANAS